MNWQEFVASDENGCEEAGNCLQFLLKFSVIPTHATKKFSNSLILDLNNFRVKKYITTLIFY